MTTWSTFARSSAGKLEFPLRVITGREAYGQRLRHRFKFFLGEWYLDLRLGVPYYDYVFTDNPDDKLVNLLFRRVVEGTPGTKTIRNMKVDIDRSTRRVDISELEIEMTTGETFYSQSETFLVKLPTG